MIVKRISLTPEVFGQVDKNGDESLWRSSRGSILHYEDGTVKKGEIYDTKYYRAVSADQADNEGVRTIELFKPEDFTKNKIHLKMITPELDVLEKFFEKQKGE